MTPAQLLIRGNHEFPDDVGPGRRPRVWRHQGRCSEDAARVFPGDRRTRLHLRPGNLRAGAAAVAALGDEIVDASLSVGVAGIPVLHRRIFDLGVVEGDQLDDRRVKLVLVALGRRAAFEIADVGALVGDDQRALELAGVLLVDAEIGRKLHRAAHARRHVDERAVREHRGIQRRVKIVGRRHRPSPDISAPVRDGCAPLPRTSRR